MSRRTGGDENFIQRGVGSLGKVSICCYILPAKPRTLSWQKGNTGIKYLCGVSLYIILAGQTMSAKTIHDARLNFRLPSDMKTVIEAAAAQLGQSVSDFAISTLVTNARNVLQQQHVTELSNRDRDIFLAMLEDTEAEPNKAL